MKQAILVVSFGTSYHDTLEKTIQATETAISQANPGWAVRRAFTSGMIIRKLKERDGLSVDNVSEALNRLHEEDYTRVVVQPTHVIHGEEYEKLCRMVRPWQEQLQITIGMPLLHSMADYRAAAQAMLDWLPTPAEDEALILMGHGSEHFANSCYAQMEHILRAHCDRIYVGTVEGYPELGDIMLQLRKRPQITKVTLTPFMLVAGDHAKNDMSGGEDSWKGQLEEAGYQVRCLLRGLGECPHIQQMFVAHCQEAMERLESRRGTLYGVGVGPGDPELLTLKAVKILQGSDVIVVPDSGKGKQVALNIVRDYIPGKELRFVSTPMVRDAEVLNQAHDRCADELCQLLEEGKQVSFITLGDPTIYSTYLYVHKRVLARGYSAEIIPGVPSFCAAAARLNQSLCEGAEPLLIIPSSHGPKPERVNKVYMKAGRSILDLQAQLRENGELENASLVENCGLPGERLMPHFADLEEPTGYFSLVISKGAKP